MTGDRHPRIRELVPAERGEWLGLRERLWPDLPREELAREQDAILGDAERNGVLVAVLDGGELAGFVEVSLREWAEGCESRPVGYVEAWYDEPRHRRAGLGRRLIDAAERWALARGCTEMGSDADLANGVSHAAHRALGYVEVGRSVLFKKKLVP